MKLSIWAETVGITAVVLSLGMVAWELQQSNSLARANVHSDINQQLNELNLETADNEDFARFLSLLRSEHSELSETDYERAQGLGFFLRNIWIHSERAFEEGWISENKFNAQLNDIDWTAETWPGLKPHMMRITKFFEKGRELTLVERRILEVMEPSEVSSRQTQ